jgi:Spy/CpxP family protein refolding chaperone
MGGRGVGLRGLDLTEAQKTQIQALRQQHQRELEAVLTPEQVAKLRARRRE